MLFRVSIGWLWASAAVLTFATVSRAGTISIGGLITQSTQDGTGPAVNNPALNNIVDGDSYVVTLSFSGPLAFPGAFNPLTGATLAFTDSSAGVAENSFTSVFLTTSLHSGNPSLMDFSLLGCLSTGSACNVGNQLSMNFTVALAGLNSSNITAQPIAGLTPSLDLLEDDGSTDIQGSVTTYSGSNVTTASAVPEPSPFTLLCPALSLIAWRMYFGAKGAAAPSRGSTLPRHSVLS